MLSRMWETRSHSVGPQLRTRSVRWSKLRRRSKRTYASDVGGATHHFNPIHLPNMDRHNAAMSSRTSVQLGITRVY